MTYAVALHLTVVQPKSRFFSASQVRDLADYSIQDRQSRTGYERANDGVLGPQGSNFKAALLPQLQILG